jgi:hypothetical protein
MDRYAAIQATIDGEEDAAVLDTWPVPATAPIPGSVDLRKSFFEGITESSPPTERKSSFEMMLANFPKNKPIARAGKSGGSYMQLGASVKGWDVPEEGILAEYEEDDSAIVVHKAGSARCSKEDGNDTGASDFDPFALPETKAMVASFKMDGGVVGFPVAKPDSPKCLGNA